MSIDTATLTDAKVIALKNAIEHDGKAKSDAVIAKTMASSPHLRTRVKEVIPQIVKIVEEVNKLTGAEQKKLLETLAPGLVNRSASNEGRKTTTTTTMTTTLTSRTAVTTTTTTSSTLPPLEDAVMGKVVTRFPPEPNGFPHIGHAKAAVIDEEYARMYNGKLILRFDDTNPAKEKQEYYDAIREGLDWLGVKPDIVKNTSDDILLLHEYGKRLVASGGAYICTCEQSKIQDLRSKGLECECRIDAELTSSERLDKMFGGLYLPNQAIIRFKGNMADLNTVMRDPVLFRVLDGDHPKIGKKTKIWPTYDFAAPIEDSIDGVTHAFRTKEYELRNELYFSLLDRLGLRKPKMIEFSRLEFEGVPVSKRKLKPLIENNIVDGWSDPRLPTLSGFKRRGFTPQAIRKFVLSLGLTLAETKPPFETLEAFNRKIIDPISMRLFFVQNPVEIIIKSADKELKVELKNHPNYDLGSRVVFVSDSLYISEQDADRLKIGDEIRLMELYNIKILEKKMDSGKKILICEKSGDQVIQSMQKIQWVAKNDIVPYKVMIPRELYIGEEYNTNSLQTLEGFAESFVSKLKPGTRIQFVRFGFCRLDGDNIAIFTHR